MLRHRDRKIDDRTFLNFAELILGNPADARENIDRIRNSLTIPKDGQAVFADLEKVYLYRYVFTRGRAAEDPFSGLNIAGIPDREVLGYAQQMLRDRETERYGRNSLYQDLLLWIAREYRRQGIGTRMVGYCMEKLRQMGVNKVALIAFANNDAGNAFWRQIGWKPCDVNYYEFILNEENITRFIGEDNEH